MYWCRWRRWRRVTVWREPEWRWTLSEWTSSSCRSTRSWWTCERSATSCCSTCTRTSSAVRRWCMTPSTAPGSVYCDLTSRVTVQPYTLDDCPLTAVSCHQSFQRHIWGTSNDLTNCTKPLLHLDFITFVAYSFSLFAMLCPVGTLCSCTWLYLIVTYCVTNKLDWIGFDWTWRIVGVVELQHKSVVKIMVGLTWWQVGTA